MGNQTAIDKFEIIETLNNYMQAIDIADGDSLRNKVFTKDASMTLLDPVSVEDYCTFVTNIMKEIKTQHFLMNSVVDVNGDTANARSYFIGFHRVKKGPNSEACDAIFGPTTREEDIVIGGTYTDQLERTPAGWRIKVRKVSLQWQSQGEAGKTLSENWMR